MLKQILIRLLGVSLLVFGGLVLAGGVVGLIEHFVDFWEPPSFWDAALAAVVGLFVAVCGTIIALRTRTGFRKPLSILESSKQPGD